MIDIRKMLGYRLISAMTERHMMRTQLADRVGIHYHTLESYLYGTFPKLETFYNLCEALDVSADYLLGRTDKMEVRK